MQVAGHAQTVVLQLRNGDRLTGTILSETNNLVTFKTTWWNVVVLPSAEIQKREPWTDPTAPGTLMKVPASTAVAPTASAATPSAALPPKPPRPWTAELQAGMDVLFSETHRQLYTGRAKLTYGHQQFRHLLDYQFSYGRTDGVLSENRMFGSLKTDYDFTRRVYVYNLGGAGYDETRLIDLRYEVGPGFGLHVVKTTNFLFNIEFGANYQAQYLADHTRTEQFYFRFAEDATWRLTPRLTFDEKFEYFPQVDNWGQYRLRFESNLRYALMSNLSFIVTVLDQFETTTAMGVGRNDLQVRSSIGVKY